IAEPHPAQRLYLGCYRVHRFILLPFTRHCRSHCSDHPRDRQQQDRHPDHGAGEDASDEPAATVSVSTAIVVALGVTDLAVSRWKRHARAITMAWAASWLCPPPFRVAIFGCRSNIAITFAGNSRSRFF